MKFITDPRMYTVFAAMLATFLAAVDTTIIETALPRIVGSLGGFSLLTWLVTAYMLTSTATMPIYGKLADVIGRKVTFTIGAVIFLIGSALCGSAQSMPMLIVFRALQGLGAGGILPTVLTILGDLFTPEERTKVQGWFSAVWGLAALTGPLLGGLIVDYFDWRWLFYINLPFGATALFMVWRYLQEKIEKKPVQPDFVGAATLMAGITCLLLLLLTGGTDFPWVSPQALGLGAGAVLFLAIFLWQERRAPDPMLPLTIFRIPAISIPLLASFMVGGVMYGFTVYLPIWAQGVQGYSATRSGATLLWFSIAWSISSVLGGRLIMKMGIRPAAVGGILLLTISSAGLVVLGRSLSYLPEVLLATLTACVGAGMGFSSLAFTLGIQHAVSWAQRGVATAALQFLRALGGLIWVSVMGGVMNLTLLAQIRQRPGLSAATTREAVQAANDLLDPSLRNALPASQLEGLLGGLADALRNVHVIILIAAIASLAITLWLQNVRFATKSVASSAAD